MPTGLFRTTDQSAHVEYEGVSIPIPRSTYDKKGYKPDFDKGRRSTTAFVRKTISQNAVVTP